MIHILIQLCLFSFAHAPFIRPFPRRSTIPVVLQLVMWHLADREHSTKRRRIDKAATHHHQHPSPNFIMPRSRFEEVLLGILLIIGGLGHTFPVLLALYVGFTTYAISVQLAWRSMIKPAEVVTGLGAVEVPSASAVGYFIIVLTVLIRLYWLGSWATGFFRCRFPRRVKLPSLKSVMQSDKAFEEFWRASSVHGPMPRPRRCKHCQFRVFLGDRVYHCQEWHRRGREAHLPMYDHYCWWLRVNVYLDTIKSHVLTIVGLILDAITHLVLSVFALVTYRQGKLSLIWGGACASAALILVILTLLGALAQLRNLVIRNSLSPEASATSFKFAFRIPVRGQDLYHFSDYIGNPWDLGLWRNLQEVLGPIWQWPNFWYRPKRVFNYGRYPGNRSDLPMSDEFRQWVRHVRYDIELPNLSDARSRRRREVGTSSSIDVTEAEPRISPV